MMTKIFKTLLFSVLLLLVSCKTQQDSKTPRWLDDIQYDSKLDKKDFVVCDEDEVYQYFNLGNAIHYHGDKPVLINSILENYDSTKVKKESGLIRIRFIVNCHGETDRFRIMQSDLNYKEKVFDKNITNQLMAITKTLDGWGQKYKDDGTSVDYWQFLNFKIVEGKIVKILP